MSQERDTKNQALLTEREYKISYCIGAGISAKRECDEGRDTDEKIEQLVKAVDAIIEVFDDQDNAERLHFW